MAFVKRGVGSIIPESKDVQGNWDAEDQDELERENNQADNEQTTDGKDRK